MAIEERRSRVLGLTGPVPPPPPPMCAGDTVFLWFRRVVCAVGLSLDQRQTCGTAFFFLLFSICPLVFREAL